MAATAKNLITEKLVRGWLNDMGMRDVARVANDQALFALEFIYPVGTSHKLSIFQPKAAPRALAVVTNVLVSPEHVQAYEELDHEAREDFLKDLTARLNVDFADYTLPDFTGPEHCPRAITISAVRYDDGLTLDSFARTVSSVFKSELKAIACVREHLRPRGFSGDFEFKRSGGGMQ